MFTIDEARQEVLASVEKLRKRGIAVTVGPEETYTDIPGRASRLTRPVPPVSRVSSHQPDAYVELRWS